MRILLLTLLLAAGAAAQTVPTDSLAGAWTVDLRPAPEADFYGVPFVVDSVYTDSTFAGSFHGSRVQNATFNLSWGVTRFAFTTDDGGSVYHTSGVLHDGWLEGTTHAVQRGFLSYWTATRRTD